MKKITFLFILLITSLGFSQEILINGDFETGSAAPDWAGNGAGANVADDGSGSNFVNAAVVTGSAEVWQTNLQQVIALTEGETYELSFDAYATANSTIIAGIGKNGGDFANSADNPALTTTSQNFSYILTANFNTVADGSRVFFDMGGAANNDGRTIFIDNVSLMVSSATSCSDGIMNGDETGIDCGGSCPNVCVVLPPPAPVPTVPDAEAYSIYNDTNSYSNFFPFVYNFGTLGGEPNLDTNGGTNLALQFDFTFAGYGVGEGGPDDVSAYDFVSFDYWAEAGSTGFRFVMISNDGGVTEHNYEVGLDEPIVTEAWTKVSIPMTFFTGLGFSETNFFQWKMDPFMQDPTTGSIVYVDNILLTQNEILSVDNFDTAQFSVYPNPSIDVWNISNNALINTVAVYNVLGKQVIALEPNATEAVIDASSLNSGIYFARIDGANGATTVKLIKK